MIWVDIVIIGVIALSALISLFRGFIREAMSLAVWILAGWVAWLLFREGAVYLESWIAVPSMRLAASFGIIFIVVLILGGIVSYIIGEIIDKTGLSGTDRIVGMIFGAVRGVLLVAVLVLLAGLTPLPQDPWWQESQLIGHFEALAQWLLTLLPPDIAEKFTYA